MGDIQRRRIADVVWVAFFGHDVDDGQFTSAAPTYGFVMPYNTES